MKQYILNSRTGTIHITSYAGKNCIGKILQEHIVEFDTLEEAKANSDRRIKECKLCFYKQKLLQKSKNYDFKGEL